MYHHHIHVAPRQVQYNAFRLLALQPPMHSLSAILAFCTLHPFLPRTGRRRCMSISLACRMFSCSCTVWVSLPHVLPGPYSFQNRSQPFFCSSSNTLPHTCDPHHPFSFISTPSSTYHFPVRHPPHVRTITSHSLRPQVDSLTTFFFIIGRHNACLYFLLFYSFNSIVLLFYSPYTLESSVVRRSLLQPKLSFSLYLSLSSVDPRSSCHIVSMLSVGNSGMCPRVFVTSDLLVLHSLAYRTLDTRLAALFLVFRLLELWLGLSILPSPYPGV